MRSVFVIGPDKKIKLMLTYPPSTGRNFDEILRVIDSLQLTANHKVVDAGELEAGRRRHHRPGSQRRRSAGAVPQGLEDVEAVPADRRAAALIASGGAAGAAPPGSRMEQQRSRS